ncbi:hypothetical protein Tco_0883419 [Tanacetum coccineum]
MLLLLVQGKLTNLNVEECLAFNVSLRMFTRSIVIQRRVEDLQLGVKSYQKKLNLTKPNTYISDLKQKEAYLAYSNPRDKMDSMHSTFSMYYDYDAHVKGELLVMMKNSQSVNLLIFISNTLIELFNDFGFDCDGIPERQTMYLNLWSYKVVRYRIQEEKRRKERKNKKEKKRSGGLHYVFTRKQMNNQPFFIVEKGLVPLRFAIFDLEPLSLSFDFVFCSEIFKSFPCVRSSNTDVLDSPCLLVLNTGTPQSRQHGPNRYLVDTSLIHIESRTSPPQSLVGDGSRRISIVIVNTKEYHSDVLA